MVTSPQWREPTFRRQATASSARIYEFMRTPKSRILQIQNQLLADLSKNLVPMSHFLSWPQTQVSVIHDIVEFALVNVLLRQD